MNPVENVWHYLRANKLAISVFSSYDTIVDACCAAWNFFANSWAQVKTCRAVDISPITAIDA